jgi:hypothetical protein
MLSTRKAIATKRRILAQPSCLINLSSSTGKNMVNPYLILF